MANSPFKSAFSSQFTPKPKHHSLLGKIVHAPLDLGAHLGTDVGEMALGFFPGLAALASHPIKGVKNLAGAEWQVWSPLFHGHPGQFAKNFYAHPLAPVLDVAFAVSLGLDVVTAGAALPLTGELAGLRAGVDVAELGKAAKTVSTLRDLRGPKPPRMIPNPKEADLSVRPAELPKQWSTRPGRYLLQKTIFGIEQHMPKVMAGPVQRLRFNQAWGTDIAHRVAAKSLVIHSAHKAAEALNGPDAPKAYKQILAGLHLNLIRHAYKMTPEEAQRLYEGGHWVPVIAVDQVNRGYHSKLRDFDKRAARANARIDKRLTAAHEKLDASKSNLLEANRKLDKLMAVPPHAKANTPANRVAEQASAGRARYRKILPELEKQANRWPEVKARFDRIMMTNELHHSDFQHFKIDVKKGTDLQKAARKLKAKAQQELQDTAEAVDKLHAARYGLDRLHLEGTDAISLQRAAEETAVVRARQVRDKQRKALIQSIGHHKTSVDAASHEINQLTQLRDSAIPGMRVKLAHRGYSDYWSEVDSKATFEHRLLTVGNWATVKSGKKWEDVQHMASRTADGHVHMVPHHDMRLLEQEGLNTSKLLTMLYRRPTAVWKSLILGWRPGFFVNNFLGNWLLYAVQEDARSAAHGLYDAMRLMRGEKATRQAIEAAVPNWMHKYYGSELGGSIVTATGSGAIDVADKTSAQLARYSTAEEFKLSHPLYAPTHKYTDRLVRMASIASYLRRNPEVQRLMKEKKYSFDKAAGIASRDANIRQAAIDHSRSIGGDYVHFNKAEQSVRALIPFYAWNRHIVRSFGNTALDHPGRVAVMQQIGNMGIEDVKAHLGEVPDFLKVALPLPFLNHGDRIAVLTTQGMNPYASVKDVLDASAAITTGGGLEPGAAIYSLANPLVGGAVEFVSGTNPLTGAPVKKHGGIIASIAATALATTPPFKLSDTLIHRHEVGKNAKGNELLYEHGPRENISSFLGFPIRLVSPHEANYLAAKEKQPKVTHKQVSGGIFANAIGSNKAF